MDLKDSKNLVISNRAVRLLNSLRQAFMEASSSQTNLFPASGEKLVPQIAACFVGLGVAVGSIASPVSFARTQRLVLARATQKAEKIVYNDHKSPSSIDLRLLKSKVEQKDSLPPSLEEYHRGRAFSFKKMLQKAKKELHMENKKPEIIRKESLVSGHYFHAEMQFVNALIEISKRLCLVPKPARQKALQAELNLLNHNLPADVCIPLWCDSHYERRYHHKVVRISPADAVVLNSAERVPFLILVEVLENESPESFQSILTQMKEVPTDFATPMDVSQSLGTASLRTTVSSLHIREDADSMNLENLKLALDKQQEMTEIKTFSERMRTAAIMLAQLHAQSTGKLPAAQQTLINEIRSRIIKEMENLEVQRATKYPNSPSPNEAYVNDTQSQQMEKTAAEKEDPSAAVFKEDWDKKVTRIRARSPFGHLPNWKLLSVIVKSDADLRQEELACQVIHEMAKIWKECDLDIWVYYFKILSTSDKGGLIETVKDSISIHSIKKHAYSSKLNDPGKFYPLNSHFIKQFGTSDTLQYKSAQDCFMRSLVGYCLVTYILQVKDRHNGNLLLDKSGHMIHIDFGFMLSNSPGYVGFETAPFKLNQEYLEILGGPDGEKTKEFKELMVKGFLALRKHADRIISMIEMMHKDSKLPCFYSGESALSSLRDRFQLSLTEQQATDFVDKLISTSLANVFTKLYDTFQYYSNGIL